MPMTTFLNPADYLNPTTNTTIDNALREIRIKTGRDWRIQEVIYEHGFFKKKYSKRYRLFVKVGDAKSMEYQVINFYRADGCSIYDEVTAEVMYAWLNGQFIGYCDAMRELFTGVNLLKSMGVSPQETMAVAINQLNRLG
jgi:hypothetical protein